jgi:hypothetical protein
MTWTLDIPQDLWRQLRSHLFPGDHDEHGAIICAGIANGRGRRRLLARELHLPVDGTDYVAGRESYRTLRAEFIRDRVLHCRDENLAYLAIHCHPGSGTAVLSTVDIRSHELGYPALLDVSRGKIIGGLVFSESSMDGELWFPGGRRERITDFRVVGTHFGGGEPPKTTNRGDYDRQARIFGDRGQALLAQLKVGVIGCGGAGSLLVEYLARLGVGNLVLADPELVDVTNLPRVAGSRRSDLRRWARQLRALGLTARWLLPRAKVVIARRLAREANSDILVEAIDDSVAKANVAKAFTTCDFLFLAADSMQARLVFNALVHQYLIPGVQVGAKVVTERATGRVSEIFSVSRNVDPSTGCLWCNGLISSAGLQEEAISPEERKAQKYFTDERVPAPSVITLNAVAASAAANDFLMRVTGLIQPDLPVEFLRFIPQRRDLQFDAPRKDEFCSECGRSVGSRFGRGDSGSLPCFA